MSVLNGNSEDVKGNMHHKNYGTWKDAFNIINMDARIYVDIKVNFSKDRRKDAQMLSAEIFKDCGIVCQ